MTGMDKGEVSIGLFGKLPAKRDFVTAGIPQAVLSPYEAWLQRELAQSRLIGDRQWVGDYLKAPIWRFWCGRRVLGQALIGVMMPSVDGVGRYFPLSLMAIASPGRIFPEAETLLDAPIFDALELVTLGALGEGVEYDSVTAGVAGIVAPDTLPELDERDAFLSGPLGDDDQAGVHLRGEAADLGQWSVQRGRAGQSVWWTLGGGGFPARIVATAGLPEGHLFAAFFNGDFSRKGEPA